MAGGTHHYAGASGKGEQQHNYESSIYGECHDLQLTSEGLPAFKTAAERPPQVKDLPHLAMRGTSRGKQQRPLYDALVKT